MFEKQKIIERASEINLTLYDNSFTPDEEAAITLYYALDEYLGISSRMLKMDETEKSQFLSTLRTEENAEPLQWYQGIVKSADFISAVAKIKAETTKKE